MSSQHASITDLISQHKPGYALPQPFYTSAEVYEHDLNTIFYREWLFATPACALGKAGSFQRLRIGAYDVIIVRDNQGGIRAFHNSCRHRGSTLCSASQGRVAKLTCPYTSGPMASTGNWSGRAIWGSISTRPSTR